MTNCSIKLKTSSVEDTAISSCYLDVNIHTTGETIKAHRLILAQKSPWFHKFFQSQKTVIEYHVVFFNISEHTVRAAVDVMNGKETSWG